MRDLEQDELKFVSGADGPDGPPVTNDPEVMEAYVEGLIGGQWTCTQSSPGAWSCVRDTGGGNQQQTTP